ncbi:hypothetical protein [Streptomyces chattanoogensis]|uniref:alpha/beta hydrolase n=1 Tax=Streptomyces chattanoogensis TaxID=66876 RepID=UPI000A9E86E3|nr:hypothetical protein [Streptomyces chattanoogensis]
MRRRFLTGAVAATVMVGTLSPLLTASAHADRAPTPTPPSPVALRLPEPGGDHQIGMTTVHLTDRNRADPWVPDAQRELMVSLWYPAENPSATPSPYMTTAESTTYVEAGGIPVPPDVLSTVGTHSTLDAEPVKTPAKHPLVVLSPGFGMPRATLTGLAEELAGRGYVVAGIGHNHEANGITFPDGHTTGCAICKNPDSAKVGDVRAADVSFVLDELTGKSPAWRYAE